MEQLIKEKLHNFKNLCNQKFPENELILKQTETLVNIPVHFLLNILKLI